MAQEVFHEHPLEKRDFKLNCGLLNFNMNFIMHYHQEIELIYMVKGTLNMTVHQQHMLLKEGDMVIVGANQIHGYNSEIFKESDENTERLYYIVIFDRDLYRFTRLEQSLISLFYDVHVLNCNENPQLQRIVPILHSLYEEQKKEKEENLLLQLGYLSQILGTLTRYGQLTGTKSYDLQQIKQEQQLLKKVSHYLSNHYREGLHLSDVASALGYSEYHFSRQFKKYAGIAFKSYLSHFQISMASSDLVDTELMVTEIAFKHGFNSIKTFNRLFKEYYHMSPTDYRKAMHNRKK